MVAADLPQVMELERLVVRQAVDAGPVPARAQAVLLAPAPGAHSNGRGGWSATSAGGWSATRSTFSTSPCTPDARRGGTGRALVQRVLDDAATHRAASVSLEVRHDNEARRGLYRAMGFSASACEETITARAKMR
jgi:GNAT superfamily N-acetyltransferase